MSQSALHPAADQATRLLGLWDLMLWVCAGMYVLVIAFLAWAIWRRRRAAYLIEPEVMVSDPGLERALGGWAVLIVVGLIVLTTASFLTDRALATPGERPLKIKVTGQQWWWRVEYQDGPVERWVETANEIRLPLGRPAEIELASDDVIHSFWIPNLAGKTDLIPGRTNRMAITPRRAGRFRGQCAEFCGFQHAHMALDVTVEPEAAFEAWRARQLAPAAAPADPQRAYGQQVFQAKACAMCHAIAGTQAGSRNGPDLTHVASRRTLAAGALPYSKGALAGWIANPQALKPGTNMPAVRLSADEQAALVAYLDGLK
ncbi:cytochrome c oxidase subunit II [Caulobacter sp. 17J80-11]|uniref:cytochrome c oxidase subunit II n=1 Tax=Caulobacter sp. 17J80-11 TaxID=2763502 RepID=UPI001653B974|nr:cytochrome c oxidase subunit II [Caulobacter sp. 17J80-11]MBC6982564.1 cytochrome c oxidase subunit II [Caulobacter sp. 17J80-11]